MTEEKEKNTIKNHGNPIIIKISIDNKLYPCMSKISIPRTNNLKLNPKTRKQIYCPIDQTRQKPENRSIKAKLAYSSYYNMTESGLTLPKKPRSEFHKEDIQALWPFGDKIEDHAEDKAENYSEEQIIEATIKELQTEKIDKQLNSDIKRAEITIMIYRDSMQILKTMQKGKDSVLIHLEQYPIRRRSLNLF